MKKTGFSPEPISIAKNPTKEEKMFWNFVLHYVVFM